MHLCIYLQELLLFAYTIHVQNLQILRLNYSL